MHYGAHPLRLNRLVKLGAMSNLVVIVVTACLMVLQLHPVGGHKLTDLL